MSDNSIRLTNQPIWNKKNVKTCSAKFENEGGKTVIYNNGVKGEELEEFDSSSKLTDAEFDSLHQELICVIKKKNAAIKTEKGQLQTEKIQYLRIVHTGLNCTFTIHLQTKQMSCK